MGILTSMKYCTGALVIVALLGVTNAIHLKTTQHTKANAKFTDDLVKSLAEDMQKDVEATPEDTTATEVKETKPVEKKDVQLKETEKKEADKKSKKAAKKVEKKEKADDEIPMDAAAIKAYSSVIADAAEDSEPTQPVIYHQVAALDDEKETKKHSDVYNPDPMGSMI